MPGIGDSREGLKGLSSVKGEEIYLDEYPTCARTFVTLCVYPADRNLRDISVALGHEPSSTSRPSARAPSAKWGWFLTSETVVPSRDLRRHLEWLIAIVAPRAKQLHALRELGARVVVSCFWESVRGHGGPMLGPQMMGKLAQLELGLDFDLYFIPESERRRRDGLEG